MTKLREIMREVADAYRSLSATHPKQMRKATWFYGIVFPVGLVYVGYKIVNEVVPFLGRHFSTEVTQVIIGLAVLLGGALLYAFRCRSIGAYGVFEVVLGAILAGYVVNQILGQMATAAMSYFTVAGALYIIVRGLDNGYKSLPAGSAATLAWNRLFYGKETDAKL